MKTLAILALTFIYILALLLAADAVQIGGPPILKYFVCGGAGSALAQLTYWLIIRARRHFGSNQPGKPLE